MTPIVQNAESYRLMRWVFDNADKGFYVITASPDTQRRVAAFFGDRGTAVYDYSKNNSPYSYGMLAQWAIRQNARILFVLNMQIALREKDDMLNLNLSRDFLTEIKRIWVFAMTPDTDELLSRTAMDFYSFVRIQAHFEDERGNEDDAEKHEIRNLLIIGGDIRNGGYYGSYEEAAQQMERYGDLRDELIGLPMDAGPDRMLTAAITLENIADLYERYGKYDDALELLERVKDIREEFLSEEHADTATVYHKIGNIYINKGKYCQSLDWHMKALAIRKKVFGDNHLATAESYNDAALVFIRQGNFDNAMEWFQKASAIHESTLGKESRDTAIDYGNIAETYRYQKNYSKAMEWYDKSLEIMEKVLGTEHPDTAKIYHKIALCYAVQSEYIKALEWFHNSLTIFEKVFGSKHLYTATTFHYIAWVYNRQADYIKALDWYEKAFSSYNKTLGKDHPETIRTNNEIISLRSLILQRQL